MYCLRRSVTRKLKLLRWEISKKTYFYVQVVLRIIYLNLEIAITIHVSNSTASSELEEYTDITFLKIEDKCS